MRRFDYYKAAFYVWLAAMLAFIITNAAAKFYWLGGRTL